MCACPGACCILINLCQVQLLESDVKPSQAHYSNARPKSQFFSLDSAIHQINHYPVDKCYGNQLRYPRNSGLSSGLRYPTFEQLGPELKTLLGAL